MAAAPVKAEANVSTPPTAPWHKRQQQERSGTLVLTMTAIERGLLVQAVRLLQRAARGEDVRAAAARFVAALEIRRTEETDQAGNAVERVFLK
jgi:hypothetical protein